MTVDENRADYITAAHTRALLTLHQLQKSQRGLEDRTSLISDGLDEVIMPGPPGFKIGNIKSSGERVMHAFIMT